MGIAIHRTTVLRGLKKNFTRRGKSRRDAFGAGDDPVQGIYENVRREALGASFLDPGARSPIWSGQLAHRWTTGFSLHPLRTECSSSGLERDKRLSSRETP